MASSTGRNGGEYSSHQSKRSRIFWTEGEVKNLIELWHENLESLRRTKRNGKIYQHIARLLPTLSDVPKTREDINLKIGNLTKQWRREKAKLTSGAGPSTWHYYNLVSQILAPLPMNDDTVATESKFFESPGSSNLERHVERHHGGVFSELQQQKSSSPTTTAATSGVKRRFDSDGPTWNPGSNSHPANEYPLLQDPIMQIEEEEEEILDCHEDLTSSTFVQDIDEDPLLNTSDWQPPPPPPPPPARTPKMRTDTVSDSAFGAAYEELAKFKRLFFSGAPEPKEHDQYGLDIAEELRFLNNPWYISMAKMRIRQTLYEIQKVAFSSASSKIIKEKDKTKPPRIPNYVEHSRTDNLIENNYTERPKTNKRRATSLQPNDQVPVGLRAASLLPNEYQTPVNLAQDPDTNGPSILPLEPEDNTLDSIIIKDEEPFDIEAFEETPPTISEDRTKSPSASHFSPVPHQVDKSCTDHSKTSKQQPLPGVVREIPKQKISHQPRYLNLSQGVVRARPPALAAPSLSAPLGIKLPQQRLVLVLPSQSFTTTTMTMTTATTTMATTATSTGLVRPSASFERQIPTIPIPNPKAPDPSILSADHQSRPFVSVVVKEEDIMDIDLTDRSVEDQ